MMSIEYKPYSIDTGYLFPPSACVRTPDTDLDEE